MNLRPMNNIMTNQQATDFAIDASAFTIVRIMQQGVIIRTKNDSTNDTNNNDDNNKNTQQDSTGEVDGSFVETTMTTPPPLPRLQGSL